MKTIHYLIPEIKVENEVSKSENPFCLQAIGPYPLINHWLDDAVNKECDKVVFHCKGETDKIVEYLNEATLWPIEKEILDASKAPILDSIEGSLNTLPGLESPAGSFKDSWEVKKWQMKLEKDWLDIICNEVGSTSEDLLTGRGCFIHKDVNIIMPCFIGDEVVIEKGATVGPYAVMGNGSVIAEGATVKNARVNENSYLGSNTLLQESILDKSRLINLKNRAIVDFSDTFIADSSDKLGRYSSVLIRLIKKIEERLDRRSLS